MRSAKRNAVRCFVVYSGFFFCFPSFLEKTVVSVVVTVIRYAYFSIVILLQFPINSHIFFSTFFPPFIISSSTFRAVSK